MKTFKYLSMMAFAAIMSFGLTACNNDDDDNAGGTRSKTSVTINGTTFSVSYGYYEAEALDGTMAYLFAAYNNRIKNWELPIHTISVTYRSLTGVTNGLEPGAFEDYIVSLSISNADESKDVNYYAYFGEDGNTGKVKVSKSGDKYTIEVPSLNYRTYDNVTNTFPGNSFTFTGTLEKFPQDFEK